MAKISIADRCCQLDSIYSVDYSLGLLSLRKPVNSPMPWCSYALVNKQYQQLTQFQGGTLQEVQNAFRFTFAQIASLTISTWLDNYKMYAPPLDNSDVTQQFNKLVQRVQLSV